MSRSPYNLGETLEVARKEFASLAPLNMAANSGCLFDLERSRITVPFLGNRYLVEYPSGTVTHKDKEGEAPIVIAILLLHYLCRASGVELASDWISFKELQGGAIYIEPFSKRAIIPFTKNFGFRMEDFVRAAEKLGGRKADHGDVACIIPALPRVPLLYVLWRGDSEFPPSGNILFDRCANTYLHTEDCAMLSGMTVGALLAALK
jgi:hypothetical protein